MKKKLDIGNITNELAGASLFFTRPVTPPLAQEPEERASEIKVNPLAGSPFFEKSAVKKEKLQKARKPTPEKAIESSKHDTVIPRHHDTMTPSNQDTMPPQIYGVVIDMVRKAVKELGKEAATHRFTITEKKELADLIYTYKNRGIRTSENEITRIAVNFIMEDFKVNGENSVLHKLLRVLNE